MKNLKLSLTGDLGSGKSTVGEILTKKLNLKKVSIGEILRELATENGMDVVEFNKYMETHPEFDNALDDKLKTYEIKDGNYLFDSRLAWHFVPSSFAVYMKADIKTSAKRIFNADRTTEIYSSLLDAENKIKNRRISEEQRYKTLYNVDISDMNNYDFVIDTDDKSPEEIALQIEKAFLSWINKKGV